LDVTEVLGGIVLTLINACVFLYTHWMRGKIEAAQKSADDAKDIGHGAQLHSNSVGASLANHKIHVAEHYSSKVDLQRVAEQFERTAERIFERIDDIANRLPPQKF